MSAPLPPGWYQDPTAQGDARYWNGSSWTESVNRGGTTVNVPIDPSQAQVPPVAGTQVSVAPPPSPVQQGSSGGSSGGSMMAVILGLLAVVLVVVVIYALVSNDDSSDSPTPGTDAPPATAAPATDPPATDGG